MQNGIYNFDVIVFPGETNRNAGNITVGELSY